jgi:Protein of unknown function (DUF2961)
MFYYHVDWQLHQSFADDVGYLHAYYRQERPSAKGKNYEFLNIKGVSRKLGQGLHLRIVMDDGWWRSVAYSPTSGPTTEFRK